MDEIVEVLIYSVAIPIVVFLGLKMAGSTLFEQIKTLWVNGKANDWVLIMRNGEMIKAGIGLRCFKGPFDQVANFPAKIHKVAFETEQVTNEMQGVKVSGMLVWSINREGDGPFNAYKNLGDLSGRPKQANDSLNSMASAVVRSCIANSSIHEMMTNRKLLRDAIHKEMFDVVKGWGVWLETIEITGVVICSASLFKDLQTNYREQKHQEATLIQMQIKSEIEQVQNQNNMKNYDKQCEINEKKKIYIAKIQAEKNEAKETMLSTKSGIMEAKEQLENEHYNFRQTAAEELQKQIAEIDTEYQLASDQNSKHMITTDQRMTDEYNLSAEIALQRTLEHSKLQKDAEVEIKLADMALEKNNMCAAMLKHKGMELAQKCYTGKYIKKINMTNMSGDDPSTAILAGMLQKFGIAKQASGRE